MNPQDHDLARHDGANGTSAVTATSVTRVGIGAGLLVIKAAVFRRGATSCRDRP
jgi:hypothetical protein